KRRLAPPTSKIPVSSFTRPATRPGPPRTRASRQRGQTPSRKEHGFATNVQLLLDGVAAFRHPHSRSSRWDRRSARRRGAAAPRGLRAADYGSPSRAPGSDTVTEASRASDQSDSRALGHTPDARRVTVERAPLERDEQAARGLRVEGERDLRVARAVDVERVAHVGAVADVAAGADAPLRELERAREHRQCIDLEHELR